MAVKKIKKNPQKLGERRQGSLAKKYIVCGNPPCRCKRTDNPVRHGPYYQISYTRKGKSRTEFVKEENLEDVKKQLANYEVFKKLTGEWIDLSLALARLRRQRQKL